MQKRKKVSKMIKIGEVCIDSGQIIVCDPTYAVEHDGRIPEGQTIQLTSNLGTSWGKDAPIAVVSYTGLGDGVYPVYVRMMDCGKWGKRVASPTHILPTGLVHRCYGPVTLVTNWIRSIITLDTEFHKCV